MFIIEDERHAELLPGEYPNRDEAIQKLRQLAEIPWNQKPNCAPCASWKTCGRAYELIEYDNSEMPWQEISREPILEIDADSVRWIKRN